MPVAINMMNFGAARQSLPEHALSDDSVLPNHGPAMGLVFIWCAHRIALS